MLLFHPYQSFGAVQEFIRRASEDPGVIASSRRSTGVGKDSPIVQALIEARRSGKQVTAVVELKARFDEASNIGWAEEMEKAGVHVVYGIPGMKIHAKLCLVVRRETQGVRRYVHIGSGNYNPSTAKIYTDMGLMTSHPGICAEVSELFNVMTGYAEKDDYTHLLVAPHGMRRAIVAAIRREVDRQRTHGDGFIVLKCNQLVDKDLHTGTLSGGAGRRARAPAGARRLLPAAQCARPEREHRGDVHRRPFPGACAPVLLPQRRGSDALHGAAPTSCPAIWIAASRCSRPSLTRPCGTREPGGAQAAYRGHAGVPPAGGRQLYPPDSPKGEQGGVQYRMLERFGCLAE